MTAMDERARPRPLLLAAAAAAIIIGAAAVAVWSQDASDSGGDPRDVLIRAVERLSASEGFAATTEYNPGSTRGLNYFEVLEFDGDTAFARWDWDERCRAHMLEDHWLGQFGSPVADFNPPGAAPHNFRWRSPGSQVEFDYLAPSVDSRITVHATAWIDHESGRLIRVERDISDPLGYQGKTVTTIEYRTPTNCF